MEGTLATRSLRGSPQDATRESPGRPGDGAHTQRRAPPPGKGVGRTRGRPPRGTRRTGKQDGLQPECGEGPGAVELPEERQRLSPSPPGQGSENTPDPPIPPGSLLWTSPTFGVSVLKVREAGSGVPSRNPSLPASPGRTADARGGRRLPLGSQQVILGLAPPRGLPTRPTPVATTGRVLQL